MNGNSENLESAAHTFFMKNRLKPKISPVYEQELRNQVLNQYISGIHQNQNNKFKLIMRNILASLRKKPVIIGAFALSAVLIIATASYVLYPTFNINNKANTSQGISKLAGELTFFEGKVEYRENEMGWKNAQTDLTLKEGTAIRVLGDGKAILTLDDGSSVRLNRDTEVTLSQLDSNHIVITNNSGEVYTRVVKSSRKFEVKANDINYESLGTAYKTINTEKLKGVEVFHSSVKAIINSKDILVEEGKKYYFANKENTDLEQKLAEISKEEVQKDTFIMWNKTEDEKKSEYKENLGLLKDLTPPSLLISAPAAQSRTTAEKITLTGTTEADAQVKVNGVEASNSNGVFSLEVSLTIGENKFNILSVDPAGNKSVKTLVIFRDTVPTAAPTSKPVIITPKISLSGKATTTGLSFSWSITGVDTSKGFKLIKDTSANPVYPGNSAVYISDGNSRNYTMDIKDGSTYNFRICQYLENGICGLYSNNIVLTAPKVAIISNVTSITLSAFNADDTVKWQTAGTAANGYKVVWSKSSGPTYPPRSGDNASYTTSNLLKLTAFDGTGSYYVKVCEYKDGACGVYSNEAIIEL